MLLSSGSPNVNRACGNLIGLISTLLITIGVVQVSAQSFEVMPGTERIFIDAQFLKFIDKNNKLSLFSRARATAEYDTAVTDLFAGGYLNYTTKSGFGGTIVGRISSFNAGVDVGVHYFKASKKFVIYALPSINISDERLYSWFSILRYTPVVNGDWRLYSSLELFSAFGSAGHLSSVQRIRLGMDKNGYQFGLAVNTAQRGKSFENSDVNPGLFFRIQF